MEIVGSVLVGLSVYAIIGVAFACWFVVAGVGRVSPAARGSGAVFRAMILPGAAALWPLLVWEVVAASGDAGLRVSRTLDEPETAIDADPTLAEEPDDQISAAPRRRLDDSYPDFVDPDAETSA